MMKFAFLIMGDFDPSKDRAAIHGGAAQIIGVKAEDAHRVVEATGNKIPVGFVTHLPEQDGIFAKAFGNGGN